MNPQASLPDELRNLLAITAPVTESELERLEQSVGEVVNSAAFKADMLKCKFVESIVNIMERHDVSQSELARRLGKSRQYLCKVLDQDEPANFTITSMTELAHYVGAELEINLVEPAESYVWLDYSWEQRSGKSKSERGGNILDFVVAANGQWELSKGRFFAKKDECALSA